jgi:hypothetical protein
VLHVTWHTDEDTTGEVVATAADGETWTQRASNAGPDHEVVMMGLPDGAELTLAVTAASEEHTWASSPKEWTIPVTWPGLAGGSVEGELPGYRLTTAITANNDASVPDAVIFDDRGRVVWGIGLTGGVPSTSAKLSADRRTLYAVAAGNLHVIDMDGEGYERVEYGSMHHDIEPLPDGSLLLIEKLNHELDGEAVTADRVVRSWPDGTSVEVWDAFSQLPTLPPSDGKEVDGARELTHANSLRYDVATGDVLVSLARMRAIVRFSLETGENRWVMSKFSGPEPAAPFDVLLQHQMFFTEQGIAMFANYTNEGGCARVLDYTAVDDAARFILGHDYNPAECMQSATLGGLADAGGGRRMITWSTAGVIDIVGAGDERLSRLSAPLGVGFGYGQWEDSLLPEE